MKVTERFTRKGDQILYEVTVDDPEVLLYPWTQNPMVLSTGGGGGPGGGPGGGGLIGTERGSCQAYELDDISTQYRH
jgi:hypothetical protein